MGVPARKVESRREQKRPHLRVVRSSRPHASSKSRAAGSTAAQNCRIFVALVALVALLGMGRVWLSVQATAASFEATDLRQSIKQERYQGDMLEVRQSALGAPSRIQAIAGKAMNMAPAESVTFLNLTEGDASVAVQDSRPTESGVLGGVLSRILDLTAGEAQVLLVGDVGLAATR